MLSDEQVMRIVRVRLDDELADLRPPGDLLDRVRDQARDQRPRAVRRRRSLRPGDALALSLSVVVVAIVVGVLVTIGGSRQPRRAVVSAGSGLPALLSKLSVLRGPQTAAAKAYDRQASQHSPGPGGRAAIHRLTRAVPVSGGATVYLLVARTGSTYGLGIAERSPTEGTGSCCLTVKELSRPHGPAVEPGYVPGNRRTIYYAVVPDGVARVRWEFPRDPIYDGSGPVPPFRHALTVTITVHDNVVAVTIPERGNPTHETWLGADGQVLASAGLAAGAPKPTLGGVTAAIKAQDQRLQGLIADHGLPGLDLTSAADARNLVSELIAYSPAQAKRLIPGLQLLRLWLARAALVVESKKASTPTQKQAQRDWVTGTRGLANGLPLAGLSDIAYHRNTAAIALRNAQKTLITCDKLRARAEQLLHPSDG